jgi:hypothetical protein
VSRRSAQPLAIAGAAVLSACGVALLGHGLLRGVLGMLLVLLVTGAAWTTLLGPTVPLADRVLAVLASSIATAILAGILLGAAGIGFAGGWWALALGSVAVAASVAAVLTGGPPASEERPRYERVAHRLRRGAPTLACFAVALAIAVLAVVLAHRSAARNGERAERIANLVEAPSRGGSR